MFFETDLVDVGEGGIGDFLWGAVGKHADQQVDDALGDDGVAVGAENQFPVRKLGVQPHLRLASRDEVLLILILRVNQRQTFS